MPKITYVGPDGVAQTHEVAANLSVMRGAVDNDVPGIRAECGGACACATCQVLVDPEWEGKIPAPGPMEVSMLEEAEGDGASRRLSCQINVTEALDGLVVHVPKDIY
jgi:2Fe-2S ferredoxin